MLKPTCSAEVLRLASLNIFLGGEGQGSWSGDCGGPVLSAAIQFCHSVSLSSNSLPAEMPVGGDHLRSSSGHPLPPQTVVSVLSGDGGGEVWSPLQVCRLPRKGFPVSSVKRQGLWVSAVLGSS